MSIDYQKEGNLVVITINRPEVMNALNMDAFLDIYRSMAAFRDDDELRVAIITGAGDRAFSAGADLKQPATRPPGTRRDMNVGLDPMHSLDLFKPMIAAIKGYCLGGGLELALTCDLRLSGENARLGLPEINRGRIPGEGGTQRLPRSIGRTAATEMLLTGRHVTAQEAYRMGLVNRVVPVDEVMPLAREWAQAMCQTAPLALFAAKEAMVRGRDLKMADAMELEGMLCRQVIRSEDFAEGSRAFNENRQPVYKGK